MALQSMASRIWEMMKEDWVFGFIVIWVSAIFVLVFVLAAFRPVYVWLIAQEMNPTALFDPKLFITLWVAEVPIAIVLRWLLREKEIDYAKLSAAIIKAYRDLEEADRARTREESEDEPHSG